MPRLTATRKQILDAMMKEAIYDAAVTVLSEQGLDGMTMDRVAAAAQVAKGSLYNYFQGKKELLEFVLAKTVAPVQQALAEIAASAVPVRTRLESLVRTLLDYSEQHRGVLRLLYRDDGVRGLLHSSERDARAMAIQQFAVVFGDGVQQGLFRPANPETLARLFFGACSGLLGCVLECGDLADKEESIRLLLEAFLYGIVRGVESKA